MPRTGPQRQAHPLPGSKKRNIIELAEKGDWIAGTGGADLSKSAGHGKLLYAMRVDKKLSLAEYCRAYRESRDDAQHEHGIVKSGRFALMSKHFFYFGKNAIDISEIPRKHLNHPFEKTGRGYRSDFSEDFIEVFAKWLNANFKGGVHGPPCKPHSQMRKPRCPSQIRRKPRPC
jgi:hypothetical protein